LRTKTFQGPAALLLRMHAGVLLRASLAWHYAS